MNTDQKEVYFNADEKKRLLARLSILIVNFIAWYFILSHYYAAESVAASIAVLFAPFIVGSFFVFSLSSALITVLLLKLYWKDL